MSRLFHPFSNPVDVDAHGELVLVSGSGAIVCDVGGRDYLDLAAGLWFCNVGHGRAELGAAAAEQMARIASYSTFGDVTIDTTVRLAERIAALAPVDDAKIFFTSGGSDSVDTAIKLVLTLTRLRGEPARNLILHRRHSYHGMHLGGTALAGIDANRIPTEVGIAARIVEWDDPTALEEAIEDAPGRVAAFFCEPVIGAGGVRAAPPDYLPAVAEICRRHGVLLVVDEVITGFGRLGHWFASERFGVRPDLLLFAKGVTSGYQPLGGVVVAGDVWRTLGRSIEGPWRHGYTYSGHATACAVALANLDLLERDGLLAAGDRLETELAAAFAPLVELAAVADVRAGVGALAAVQLAPDAGGAARAVQRARDHGVITRALAGESLQISPPLCMSTHEVRRAAEVFRAALSG
jgi:adenosylmethionine-8-amino-7-oxononanoate aminotransferase